MTTSSHIVAVRRPEDVEAGTLLGICASLKPAPTRGGRSAARSLLVHSLDLVAGVYPAVRLLDLRDHPPPFFDGRMPQDHDHPTMRILSSSIDRAGALLCSVPAYWSGVSGVFKNFVDVICGPAYDLDGPVTTVFTNKPVGLLVIGADEESARAGAEQATAIFLATGARVVGSPVIIANPRLSHTDPDVLGAALLMLAGELAQHACRAVLTEEA